MSGRTLLWGLHPKSPALVGLGRTTFKTKMV
jgi:hypothetical protein